MRFVLIAILILGATGAIVWFSNHLEHFGTPGNPNDPKQAGMLTPEVLRRNLAGASDSLMERVRHGEFNDAKFKDLMAKEANTLLDEVDIEKIPAKQAWEYGEIYITARRWQDARKALEIATKVAHDEDRRVNDNLRLARVLAMLGDVPAAIKTARSTYNTPDRGAAPILPATLLEIVPASIGKGQDEALAKLLEEAIACEERTIVDPEAEAGKAFLLARPVHIRHAWEKIVRLYQSTGESDLAAKAQARADSSQGQTAGV